MTATDQTPAYANAYRAIRSPDLRERLHLLAHDPRIPALLRPWALSLMAWRAGNTDRFGQFVLYPTPPSGSVPLDVIGRTDRIVCRELVPDFRGERWRRLRGIANEGEAA